MSLLRVFLGGLEPLLEAILAVLTRGALKTRVVRNGLRRRVKAWPERLNKEFSGEFVVLKSRCGDPKIHVDGFYALPPDLSQAGSREKRRLREKGRPNDMHAMLSREPTWRDEPVHLHIESLEFSTVEALRTLGEKPEILSASVVIVCDETKELLLHRRALDSSTFGGLLHTLGGALIPDVEGTVHPDRNSLINAALREVFEESAVRLSEEDFPSLMLSKEVKTGFIQLVCLGVPVSEIQMNKIIENWEGRPVRVSFQDLRDTLSRESWVPSGKAHVLAWLALGAPNAGLFARFGGLSSSRLFEQMVRK